MERKKRSKIWLLNDFEMGLLVKDSFSIAEVLRKLGQKAVTGSNAKSLKNRLDISKINYSHFKGNGRGGKRREIPLENILIKNSSYDRKDLKRRLLEKNILKNECTLCGLKDTWNNKKIVMIIDHINGINNDNRIENLRMVCPNCNSQLETHSGKNNKEKCTYRTMVSSADFQSVNRGFNSP